LPLRRRPQGGRAIKMSSGRMRKVAPPSTAMPAIVTSASAPVIKVAPNNPGNAMYVTVHSGAKEGSKLKPFKDAPAWFRPTLTPHEMLVKGMHGGIYFNPKGGKPGVKYPRSKYPKGIPGVTIDEYPEEWFAGVKKELYLSRRYSVTHNCYGVKSGLDQAGWESSGWINECDPRGWTQWYFRFFMGRRLAGGEDERQMGRWNGVCGEKGRWKSNLIAKCLRDGKAHDDVSVSPVVRQTLLHWAYEISESDFDKGSKRVKTHGAAYVNTDSLGGKKRKQSFDDSEDDTAEVKAATAEELAKGRKERAQRRAAGEAVEPPPKKPRAVAKTTKAERSAAPPENLSAYEKKRDKTRAENEERLKELGL